MKTVVLTSSSSSAKSSTTMDDRSENRDSCYFPGCRKDTNCNCEICLASINATLDLMPMSVQKSSLTKLSASKSTIQERTPISFNKSILSTPKQGIRQILETPPLKSTAKSIPFEKPIKKRKKSGFLGFYLWRIFVGFCLIFAVDSGFSWMVSELLQPTLSPEMVNNLGKQSLLGHDLNEKLGLLQRKLGKVVTGKVSSCNSKDSIWELNQGGPLVNSRCKLYKSMAEEVSIWGWPLQTAGLLATGFSSRSFTVLSGRITEWPNGKVGFSIRNSNNSWVLGRMSASAIQLDPNTWVLEYRQSSILENSRLFRTAMEFFKIRISGVVGEMKQQVLMLPTFVPQYSDLVGEDGFSQPT